MPREVTINIETTADLRALDRLITRLDKVSNEIGKVNRAMMSNSNFAKAMRDIEKTTDKATKSINNNAKAVTSLVSTTSKMGKSTRDLLKNYSKVNSLFSKSEAAMERQQVQLNKLTAAEKRLKDAETARYNAALKLDRLKKINTTTPQSRDEAARVLDLAEREAKAAQSAYSSLASTSTNELTKLGQTATKVSGLMEKLEEDIQQAFRTGDMDLLNELEKVETKLRESSSMIERTSDTWNASQREINQGMMRVNSTLRQQTDLRSRLTAEVEKAQTEERELTNLINEERKALEKAKREADALDKAQAKGAEMDTKAYNKYIDKEEERANKARAAALREVIELREKDRGAADRRNAEIEETWRKEIQHLNDMRSQQRAYSLRQEQEGDKFVNSYQQRAIAAKMLRDELARLELQEQRARQGRYSDQNWEEGQRARDRAEQQAIGKRMQAREEALALEERIAEREAALARKATERQARQDALVAERNRTNTARNETRTMQHALEAGQRAAQHLNSSMSRIMQTINSVTSTIRSGLNRSLTEASQTVGRFANTAASQFSRIRAALDGTGRSFLGFGNSARSGMGQASRAVQEFYAAGWSLLASGAVLNQFGDRIFGGITREMDQYLDYETALTRTAISAAIPNQPNEMSGITAQDIQQYGSGVRPEYITQMIQALQRGQFMSDPGNGKPIPINIDSAELARGLYYYTSAVGQPITPGNMADIGPVVARIMAMADATQTGVETATKGVINIAQEFGIDVRGAIQEGEGGENYEFLQRLPGQLAYLANVSTMEVPDVIETFKMLGPLASVLSGTGESPGEGLTDMMALTFMASEMGLRGGNVGRGFAQGFATMLDPTDKLIGDASAMFPEITDEASFKDFFFDDQGDLEGGLQGFIQKFADISAEQPGGSAELLAKFFTQNATRSMIAVVEGWLDNPERVAELSAELAGEKPQEFLNQAILATNDTIGGHLQYVKNAFFAAELEIIEAISGPLKAGLEAVGDVLWNIADLFNSNPAFAAFAGWAIAAAGAIATFLGGLLATAGTILLFARAMAMVGAAGRPFLMLLTAIPRMLLLLSPMLLLISALVIGLAAAWNNNFMGMQTATRAFIDNFSIEKDVIPKLMAMATAAVHVGNAFKQFVSGILLGIGPTNDLAALIMKVFGPRVGGFLMDQLAQLRFNLRGVRKDFMDFFSDLASGAQNISGVGRAIQGIMEAFLFGQGGVQTQNRAASDALAAALGIDNPNTKIAIATNAVREFLMNAVAAIGAFRSTVAPMFESIGDSLEIIFSRANVGIMLGALATAIGAAFAGAAGTIVVVINALDQLLQRVARLNEIKDTGFGKNIQKYNDRFLDLNLTVDKVAKTIGATLGAALGVRLLTAILPGANLLAKFGTILGEVGVRALGSAAQLALFGLRIAANIAITLAQVAALSAIMAVKVALGVVTLGLASAEALAALAAGELAIAELTGLAAIMAKIAGQSALMATMVGYVALLGNVVVAELAVAAAGLVMVGLFVAIGGAMLVAVAATSGWSGVLQALQDMWTGFAAVMSVVITVIMAIVVALGTALVAILNFVSGGNAFVIIGAAIAVAITVMLAALVALIATILTSFIASMVMATGAVIAFVAAFVVANLPMIALIALIIMLADQLARFAGFDSIFDFMGTAIQKIVNITRTLADAWHAVTDAITTSSDEAAEMARKELEYSRQRYLLENAQSFSPEQRAAERIRDGLPDWDSLSYEEQDREQAAFYARQERELADQWTMANGGYQTRTQPGSNFTLELDPIAAIEFDQNLARQQKVIEERARQSGEQTGSGAKDAYETGWMQTMADKLGLSKLLETIGVDVAAADAGDWTKALGLEQVTALDQAFSDVDMSMLGPEMQAYMKEVDAWSAWQKTVDLYGAQEAHRMYFEAGMPIPKMPSMKGLMDAWTAETTGALDDAGDEAAEAAKAMWEQVVASLEMPDFASVISSGVGNVNGAMTSVPKLLMQNAEGINSALQEAYTAVYGEGAEFHPEAPAPTIEDILWASDGLMDMAASGGKNIQAAVAGDAGVQAFLTGLGLDPQLVANELPKYLADPAIQSAVQGVMFDQINPAARDALGLAGIDWRDVSEYAASNIGKDWDLSHYMMETMGWDQATASQWVADNFGNLGGAQVIGSSMFEGLEGIITDGFGNVVGIASDVLGGLPEIVEGPLGKTMEMTKAEFDALDPLLRAALQNAGVHFDVAMADMQTAMAEGGRTFLAAMDTNYGILSSYEIDGVTRFGAQLEYISTSADGTMVTVRNALGQTIEIPAPEYQAYVAALSAISAKAKETRDAIDKWLSDSNDDPNETRSYKDRQALAEGSKEAFGFDTGYAGEYTAGLQAALTEAEDIVIDMSTKGTEAGRAWKVSFSKEVTATPIDTTSFIDESRFAAMGTSAGSQFAEGFRSAISAVDFSSLVNLTPQTNAPRGVGPTGLDGEAAPAATAQSIKIEVIPDTAKLDAAISALTSTPVGWAYIDIKENSAPLYAAIGAVNGTMVGWAYIDLKENSAPFYTAIAGVAETKVADAYIDIVDNFAPFATAIAGVDGTTVGTVYMDVAVASDAGLNVSGVTATAVTAEISVDASVFNEVLGAANVALNNFDIAGMKVAEIGIDNVSFITTYNNANANLDAFDARNAIASISLNNNDFIRVIDSANNALNVFDAREAYASISITDNATSVINEAIRLLNNFAGRTSISTIITRQVTEVSTVNGGGVGFSPVQRASGGRITEDLTLVGEGPELISAPGAYVHSVRETAQILALADSMNSSSGASFYSSNTRFNNRSATFTPASSGGGGGDIHVEIGTLHVAKEVDIDKAFERIDRLTGRRMELERRGMGGSNVENRNF